MVLELSNPFVRMTVFTSWSEVPEGLEPEYLRAGMDFWNLSIDSTLF